MSASEARIPRARLIVAIAAIVVSAAILVLARNFTFYFDEWDFILTSPDWTLVTYLQPHNEHPSMLFRLVYAGLLGTVGLRSYVPYMAVVLTFHAANALLLFEVVRRRAGDLAGMAAAALLLVLGAGWEDLLWAFQLAWLASIACGLAMLLVLQGEPARGKLPIAIGLLTASLMFSGIGIVFAVAAVVQLAVTPARRRDLRWFVPLGIALAAWYLAFGRSGTPPHPAPSISNLAALPAYMAWGLGAGVAGIVGAGGGFGPVLLLAALGGIGFAWLRRRPDPMALAIAAGLISFYVVTGLTRAQLGYQQSGAGRYVYVGAVFWLILLADLARFVPWRGTWRPVAVACLFLACFNGGVLLFAYAAAKTAQMEREIADLSALAAERSDPCLNPQASVDPLVMPQVVGVALYYRAVDRYGDPSTSRSVVDHAAFALAHRNLVRPGCK